MNGHMVKLLRLAAVDADEIAVFSAAAAAFDASLSAPTTNVIQNYSDVICMRNSSPLIPTAASARAFAVAAEISENK